MSDPSGGLWHRRLRAEIEAQGGLFNAHLHLDRAHTLDESYLEHVGHRILESSHVSLHRKHSMITDLHRGRAYQPGEFERRVNAVIDELVAAGTARADTLVDVTCDGVGLSALERMQALRAQRAAELDLRIAAYTPFGFDDHEPERWELFAEGARRADFVATLPEADDRSEYPSHIGFDESCRRALRLAQELDKPLHVHVDQRNEPSETGTEALLRAIREVGAPRAQAGEPAVWAVHSISPSTYDEERFRALVDGMLECGVGLITCPSAALGMRMYRPLHTPTYNSIPRVLELLAAGVAVRMGSDNIGDICSPSTSADLFDEVFVLSAAIRFYNPEILARLAAGRALDEAQRAALKQHLARNDEAIARFLRSRAAAAPERAAEPRARLEASG